VLITVREQAALVYSTWAAYRRAGSTLSLKKFLRQDAILPFSGPVFRYEMYEFDHLVGYYYSLFGDANVLVLPHEMLLREPAAFFKALSEFSGAAVPDPIPPQRMTNIALPPTKMWLRPLTERFGRTSCTRPDATAMPMLHRAALRLETFATWLTPKVIS